MKHCTVAIDGVRDQLPPASSGDSFEAHHRQGMRALPNRSSSRVDHVGDPVVAVGGVRVHRGPGPAGLNTQKRSESR
jgi:hypothetical protein